MKEGGSPRSLIHRIDQAGMRVIYYFDKIRSSDAHRYPRRSISFFLSFLSSLFSPSVSGTEFVCYSDCLCVCVCVERGVCVRALVGVWMGDNKNSIRKCGEEMRRVLLVGARAFTNKLMSKQLNHPITQ